MIQKKRLNLNTQTYIKHKRISKYLIQTNLASSCKGYDFNQVIQKCFPKLECKKEFVKIASFNIER